MLFAKPLNHSWAMSRKPVAERCRLYILLKLLASETIRPEANATTLRTLWCGILAAFQL